MGASFQGGNGGTFNGTPIPVAPGILSPVLTIPAIPNLGCYDAMFSLTIRATATVSIPAGGNQLDYVVELDGVPQRFGFIQSNTAAVNTNVYEEYVYDTIFVVAGGVVPAKQLRWRFTLASGLLVLVTNWTVSYLTGPPRSMPTC